MHETEQASLHEQGSLFFFLHKKDDDGLCKIVKVLNFQNMDVWNKCYPGLK